MIQIASLVDDVWPPAGVVDSIRTVDMHTAGEPLRILVDAPVPPGSNVAVRREAAGEILERLRKLVMFEPRGHADMYGAVLTPPDDDGAAFGVLFLHNEGFSTMCGHAVIALGKAAVELGWVLAEEPLTRFAIDTPAGRVDVEVEVSGGRATSSRFENVPAFVAAAGRTVELEGIGRVAYDLAFGGAFYAYVDAAAVGLDLAVSSSAAICDLGRRIKRAVSAADPISYPGRPDLSFLYGVIFVGPSESAHSRHACVFADGALDRSPTGTGVAGRLAILHEAGALAVGEVIEIESLSGGRFTGAVVGQARVGDFAAVRPLVGGTASFIGRAEFVVEHDDNLGAGFLLP